MATRFSETVFSSVIWLICVLAWRAGYEITLGEPTIDKLVRKASEREIKLSFGMQLELGEEKIHLGYNSYNDVSRYNSYNDVSRYNIYNDVSRYSKHKNVKL